MIPRMGGPEVLLSTGRKERLIVGAGGVLLAKRQDGLVSLAGGSLERDRIGFGAGLDRIQQGS